MQHLAQGKLVSINCLMTPLSKRLAVRQSVSVQPSLQINGRWIGFQSKQIRDYIPVHEKNQVLISCMTFISSRNLDRALKRTQE